MSTMLYLKALREGLNVMPASDPAIRTQIDQEAAASSWPAMHGLLQRIDPITAERLNPNDQQRIQRALEVWRISGKPLSSFHAEESTEAATPVLPLRVLAIIPEDRAELHERIAARFHTMIDQGRHDLHALRRLPTSLGTSLR
jgi:tRNA dimethylallyltransferase